jgi:hypothetical protein
VPPCNDLHKKREQFDASFGETLNGFLFMSNLLATVADKINERGQISDMAICRNPQRNSWECACRPS